MRITKNSTADSLLRWRTHHGLLFLLFYLLCGCKPDGPKSLLLGAKYIREGDYPRALKHLEKAAELMPAHPQVWNHLGLAFHFSKQPQKAAEAYQRALRIDQQLAAAHFNLGTLLLEQSRPQDAVTELSAFTALQPTNSLGFSKLGRALLRAKRPEEAERALNQALRLNPRDAEAHNDLGLIHVQRKRPRDAMLEFNAALQNRPGFPAALLNQAIVAQLYFLNTQMAAERYRAYLSATGNGQNEIEVRQLLARLEEAPVPKPVEAMPALDTNRFQIPPVITNAPVAEAPPNPPPKHDLPSATNLIAATRRNSTPVVPIHDTNLTQISRVEPLTNKPTVQPEPATPIQVVELGTEPEFKAPSDVRQEPETKMAAAKPPDEPLIPPRKGRVQHEQEKSGILEKLNRANPMRWFRNEEKPAAAKPANRPETVPQAVPQQTARRVEETAEPAPPPKPAREFARYPYQPKTPPPKGNRTQAEKYFIEGARAHQERRLAAAIEAYRQAVTADPSYFDAQYNLGLAAVQMKDLPLALLANENARRLKPDSVDARYHFAITLRDANYPVDAANELRELLVDAPDEARAHLALANLYAQQLDEPVLAQRHYNRLLDLAPNHPEASAIRQWLAKKH